jgi:methylmalonyl-CoA mutase N-terminal domain/subunit
MELAQKLKIERRKGCTMQGQGHVVGVTGFVDVVLGTTTIMMLDQSPREIETAAASKLEMSHRETIREKVKKKRLQKRRLRLRPAAPSSTAAPSESY